MDQETAVKVQEAAVKDQEVTSTTVDEAEPKMESLSSKISNLHVLNGSLQTVSKTCKDIKESNAYVKYGIDVAESSLDKAMKAGKSVLDSSTLAPVTTKAMENIHFLDKEAGVIIDKFFGTKAESECRESEGLQKNGSLQTENGIQELAESGNDQSKDISKEESTTDNLSRKLFEIILFLFSFPRNAITSFLHLFQLTPESTRKRKERGSISEELQKLEPSPVKRKYGDRKSSSDEGSLVEMLRVNENYVSEEDADYVPDDDDDDLGEIEQLTDSDEKEIAKEAEDLKRDLTDHEMLLLSSKNDETINRRIVENLELKDLKKGGENNDESCAVTKDAQLCAATDNQECPNPGKAEKTVSESTKTNEKEPLQSLEITPIENVNTTKAKTTGSKEKDASKEEKSTTPTKEISPSTKTRKSSKSPLLGKFLSPRRSEKGKGKSIKEVSEHDKSEKTKSEKSEKAEKNEKSEKPEKTTKSEKTVKSEKAKKSEKSEISEKPTPDQNVNVDTNSSMSAVSGPFDMFKMGGKKSK